MSPDRLLCEVYGAAEWSRGVSHNLPDWRGINVQLYHAVIAFARGFIARRCIYDAFSVRAFVPRGAPATRTPRTMHFYYCAIFSRLLPARVSHRDHLKGQKPGRIVQFRPVLSGDDKKNRGRGRHQEREKREKSPAFSPRRIKWSPAICHLERGDVFLRGWTNPSVVFSTRPSPTNPRTINLLKVLQIASPRF